VFWKFDRDKNLYKKLLTDPQQWNSYSYSRGNPITNKDPNGESLVSALFKGKYASEQDQQDLGEAVNYQYNNSATWKVALDNPVKTGIIVAVGGGVLAGIASTASGGSILLSTDATGSLITPVGVTAIKTRDALVNGVENQKLVRIINKLYQKSDTIPGGTIGAVKNEIQTGELTKGTNHLLQRAPEAIRALQKVIANPSTNSADANKAQTLIKAMQNALKGK
jgi:hypothetical protein